jgi:adenosine deaminase
VQLGKSSAKIEEHPLAEIVRRGVAVTISTDDPAMFHTSLEEEYRNAWRIGLTEEEIAGVVENGFRYAFGKVG